MQAYMYAGVQLAVDKDSSRGRILQTDAASSAAETGRAGYRSGFSIELRARLKDSYRLRAYCLPSIADHRAYSLGELFVYRRPASEYS